ncbi:DUF4184 family protein [Streptomyces griseoaurantiacus]|uniref:DUF4184 family protein n=1 Tax=Streptomyces griseoaurantiacus TaxID=68213 RepID=A0A7W2HWA7_9ACTN|nr:DUF4184 family protein [Streptomyces griseoaurantiacus]MBA5223991.1 DUF4184 family protein [Streptomyces griseoaurantiacus]
MPFTPAHPAAVLPLLRPPFSPAALVCGAMAPDMPYFLAAARIPVSARSWYEPFLNATVSHGLSGIAVSVSFALALLLLYAGVRRPVAALLPGGRAPHGRGGRSARRVGGVLLSVLIGVATHLLWDSFTHADGWAVVHVSPLRARLAGDLTVARAVQHLSTAGGLAAVAAHLWRRGRRAPGGGAGPTALPAPVRRTTVVALALAALAGAAARTQPLASYRGGPAAADRVGTREALETVASDWTTGGGAALVLALLLYACLWWGHRAWRIRTARSTREASA